MKKVSVYLITYNHEKYIAQAIESIVSQKVNFEFELVIGEDLSKDNTRAICEQYSKAYPAIINLLPSDKNYGPIPNAIRTLAACTGKYIALCEGDDYWTDPCKLQKQADFMDTNEDFSLCFSDVGILDEMGLSNHNNFPPLQKEVYTIEDVITAGYCFIPTVTLFFRNILPNPMPDFFRKAVSGDIALHLLLTDKGKARYFREKTAVYRHHPGGITKSEENIKVRDDKEFLLYVQANEYFGYKYDKIFRKHLLQMAKTMLIYGARNKKGMEKIKHYFKRMPRYLKYSDGVNFKELVYFHTILFFPSLLKLVKSRDSIAG
jgi:glycosyltransferase involved in cell wall biosynthesis